MDNLTLRIGNRQRGVGIKSAEDLRHSINDKQCRPTDITFSCTQTRSSQVRRVAIPTNSGPGDAILPSQQRKQLHNSVNSDYLILGLDRLFIEKRGYWDSEVLANVTYNRSTIYHKFFAAFCQSAIRNDLAQPPRLTLMTSATEARAISSTVSAPKSTPIGA